MINTFHSVCCHKEFKKVIFLHEWFVNCYLLIKWTVIGFRYLTYSTITDKLNYTQFIVSFR